MPTPNSRPEIAMTETERLINELMKIHPKGFDLSLDRIRILLEKLGNPHHQLPPVIHVAGTNGKGSTIAFCRAILEAAGLAVHVHTSPHLVNWHERYRIGQKNAVGQLVDDDVLADAISRVTAANDGQPITVFEVLSAVTFVLFNEHPADVCLIEVGLGGRFDATNVIEKPAISIITPVSIDHEAFLGNTLAKIAFEKAGIIKKGAPVVCGVQEQEALTVIEKQARHHRALLMTAGEHYSATLQNGRMVWQDDERLLDLAPPRLLGEHQIENAATAIAACDLFAKSSGIVLQETIIEQGLQSASWPGRMQSLSHGKLFDLLPAGSELWIDGGHNPGAAAVITRFMQNLHYRDKRPLTIICGMLTTKDPSGYFDYLKDLDPEVITVPVLSSDAGFSAEDLADHAANSGLNARPVASLKDAFASLGRKAAHRVLVAGSLYLAGDMLAQNDTAPT